MPKNCNSCTPTSKPMGLIRRVLDVLPIPRRNVVLTPEQSARIRKHIFTETLKTVIGFAFLGAAFMGVWGGVLHFSTDFVTQGLLYMLAAIVLGMWQSDKLVPLLTNSHEVDWENPKDEYERYIIDITQSVLDLEEPEIGQKILAARGIKNRSQRELTLFELRLQRQNKRLDLVSRYIKNQEAAAEYVRGLEKADSARERFVGLLLFLQGTIVNVMDAITRPLNSIQRQKVTQVVLFILGLDRINLRPRLYLSEQEMDNAFAFGMPGKTGVGYTRGFLDLRLSPDPDIDARGVRLDDDEVRGVAGHEFWGHIDDYDVIVNTFASIAGAILQAAINVPIGVSLGALGLAVTAFVKTLHLPEAVKELLVDGVLRIVGQLAQMVTGEALKIVQLFIVRSRESLADGKGAFRTGKPRKLGTGLRKIVLDSIFKNERSRKSRNLLQFRNGWTAYDLQHEITSMIALRPIMFIDSINDDLEPGFVASPRATSKNPVVDVVLWATSPVVDFVDYIKYTWKATAADVAKRAIDANGIIEFLMKLMDGFKRAVNFVRRIWHDLHLTHPKVLSRIRRLCDMEGGPGSPCEELDGLPQI